MKLFTATQVAKELGFTSGNQLNRRLESMGVIEKYHNGIKENSSWRLKPEFEGYQLTEYIPKTIERSNGDVNEILNMKWTQHGKDYLGKHKDRIIQG